MSTITQTCTTCQVDFQADKREVNRGNAKYCSRQCFGARIRPTPKPNTTCGLCNVGFYTKQSRINKSKSGVLFCSAEHQKEAFAKGIISPGPKATIDSYCSKCNKYLGKRAKICTDCRKQAIIDQWLAGDNSVTLQGGETRQTKTFVKRYLLEVRGDQCEQCGFSHKAPDGRSIIQMDHIDGNCLNNDPANLRLLCPNCHAMTPTYGSLNKGSGRAYRRKNGGRDET